MLSNENSGKYQLKQFNTDDASYDNDHMIRM